VWSQEGPNFDRIQWRNSSNQRSQGTNHRTKICCLPKHIACCIIKKSAYSVTFRRSTLGSRPLLCVLCSVQLTVAALWLLYIFPDLTFKNSTFFSKVCIGVCCVVLIPVIISLYNINLSVFIIETEIVYCAVRTEALNAIIINLDL
jgi:hypothetical protein